MSGLDMRTIMENLNTETPKVKLNESLGGTPMANDIMELAAKIEATQNAPVDESMEDEELNEVMDERLTQRQMWNRIMKIMGDAGDQGLIEDIGNKPDPKYGRVHEFMIDDGIFKIIKEDD